MTGIQPLWFDIVVSQQELHPTTDTTQGPLAPEARFHLRFEKFSAFIEEYRPKISLGGMFLETDELKPVGSIVACDFELTDGFRLCQALGEVVWTRREAAGPGQPPGMGIRFQAIDDKGRELVLKIIDEQKEAGGQPFEVERVPPGAEAVPVASSPAPREDPAATMSRKAVAPREEPAATHVRPAAPAAATDLSDAPIEILAEDDPGFTLEPSGALEIEPLDSPLRDDVPVESAPIEEAVDFGDVAFDSTPFEGVSFDDDKEDFSFDAGPGPADANEPVPALELGDAGGEFGFGAAEVGPVDFPASFDAPEPADTEGAFEPSAAPDSAEAGTGEEPPETLVLPALKEEEASPGSAWSFEPESDDTNPSGLDLLASDPALQRTPEVPVGMDSDLFGDKLPEDSTLGDELPADDFGGDQLPYSEFGETPAEPAPSVFGTESDYVPEEDWDEEAGEWDDEYEEEPSRLGLLKIALMESKGRILGLMVFLALVVGGYLFKDQILDLVGFGSPPEAVAPASPPARPQPAPAQQAAGEAETPPPPETIVAEPPEAVTEPEAEPPPPAMAETPSPELPPPTPPPEPTQASDLRPAASNLRPSRAPSTPATQVLDITYEQTAAGTRILVRLDGDLPQDRIEHNPLSYDPLKEQVVLRGIRLPYRSRIDVGTLELDRIRTGLHGNQLNLVFDLSSEVMTLGEVRDRGAELEILVRRR